MNYNGRITMSYEEVKSTIQQFTNTKEAIRDDVNEIRRLLEESKSYFVGAAGDAARESINVQANACYSCSDWINDMGWQLSHYADLYQQEDLNAAQRINRGGM